LADVGVHRHRQAGISGRATEGADSIVLSGGYEDDQDFGDVIVYTGYGGRDPATGKQVSDQPFSMWNRALAYSSLNGLPVRVIRGAGHDSPYSPGTGYSYDGLYLVEDYWHETGRSGFRIWRYRLTKLTEQLDDQNDGKSVVESPEAPSEAPRQETTVLRIVRDTRQARQIKELYDYRCQMCGVRIEGLAGPYAEAAHIIRPLGAPHNGPDKPDNILCLCPNHHVLFDHGGITIDEDLSLVGADGRLEVSPQHRIDEKHLRYRREHY
jgi:putative restriction endonuclease